MIKITRIRNGDVFWIDEQGEERRSRCTTISTHAEKDYKSNRWKMIKKAMDAFFNQFKKGDCVLYCGELLIVNQPAHMANFGSVPLKATCLRSGESYAIEDFEYCKKTDGVFFESKSELWELVRLAIHDNTVAISKLGELLGSN